MHEGKRKFDTNANRGCLGYVYRRRTHIAAKLVGEELRSIDPAVSEWGNPLALHRASALLPNSLPFGRLITKAVGTRGTETSKYPKEKKSNEIA